MHHALHVGLLDALLNCNSFSCLPVKSEQPSSEDKKLIATFSWDPELSVPLKCWLIYIYMALYIYIYMYIYIYI